MISIIVVGYNSRKYLPNCFTSIFRSSFKKFQVIFVDNHSSDKSVEYIRNNFPKVHVVKSEQNLGFAKSNNVGIEKALKLKADYLFFLNPDTILDEKCLEILTDSIKSNEVLQPLILISKNGKKTENVNTSGSYLNYLGISYCDDYRKNFREIKDKEITTASGAACLVPVRILKKIDFFDENFFMYHEDVDLFWRARIAGFNIRLNSKAKVWHEYSFSKDKNKFLFIERNRLVFLLKNFSIKYLILILPISILNELLMIIYSLFGGWFLLKIKSYYLIIKMIPNIISKRKQISKIRRVSERELKKFLMPRISFSEINSPLLNLYNYLLSYYSKLVLFLI